MSGLTSRNTCPWSAVPASILGSLRPVVEIIQVGKCLSVTLTKKPVTCKQVLLSSFLSQEKGAHEKFRSHSEDPAS